jgi:sarcosine oxidase subunit delta
VHLRNNIGGIQREWWYHRDGCGSWFTIRRDTLINVEIEGPEEI